MQDYSQGLILVEGQTEEAFVNSVLSEYLHKTCGIWLQPIIVKTKTVIDGPDYKGGDIRYAKLKPQLLKLFYSTNIVLVTTMLDFYRLGEDFPGYTNMPAGDCYKKVEHIEGALSKDINQRNFIPYIQMHEFESFLFVKPEITARILLRTDTVQLNDQLESIKREFNTPEEIDDGNETAPSKRIIRLYNGYSKLTDGSIIVKEIGIENLIKECPHFKLWIDAIKSFAEQI